MENVPSTVSGMRMETARIAMHAVTVVSCIGYWESEDQCPDDARPQSENSNHLPYHFAIPAM